MAKAIGYYSHAHVTSYDFSLSRLELKTLFVALMKEKAIREKPICRWPLEIGESHQDL